MKIRTPIIRVLLTCALLSFSSAASAQDKPNIVLVFMDNFGWGEPGFNGGVAVSSAVRRRLGSTRWLRKDCG